ncbi:MAG: RDD family protein [Thiomicrorhabdus sp.]|nr:RDD family protein [Thiomicrorhabdus sp.]
MMNNLEYAGFWIRVGATLIDTLILLLVTTPILLMIYGDSYWVNESLIMGGWDFIISYVFPAIAVIMFWTYKSATPGKMALKLTILDAKTGQKPTTGQFIIRYLGYFVSSIPLFLGLIWVGINKRKQGWHDKMAGTVVVRNTAIEPVEFGQ